MKHIKPTSEYGAFQAAIAARPYDPGAWCPYIDWLTEQERHREACVARIALEQRTKFGPLQANDFVHDGRFDQQRLISRFVLSCHRILAGGGSYYERDGARKARFRSRCEFQTRTNPRSMLPEYRVVGPDPKVHPLDCPGMDEHRRRTAWKPYPDVWYCVWVRRRVWDEAACKWTTSAWEMLGRNRSLDRALLARSATELDKSIAGCVIRDQDGKVERRQPLSIKLPEDSFDDA